jgi:TolA-binding protein
MDSKHRHELKQNEFAIATMTVADRLAEHRKTILAVVGALVVLAVIAGGVMAYRTRQANAAGAALGIAMATAEAQVIPAPTLPGATQTPGTFPTAQARADAAIKAFTDVTTTYPGTEAARIASFHLASQLLAGGKAAEAEQAFAALATDEGNTLRGQSAKLGQAEALMALGRTDEALKIYTDLAAVRDGALPVDGLLMQLGRASQRAGKTAEARAAFQRVIDEFPESGFVPAAQQQIAAMN